ncbi:MAG TPA: hypothetical protein VN696_07970 [Pyrinomonadaceae bacterium]|nr:hypothetical protein [Pyrinomonadaceae bacterium]
MTLACAAAAVAQQTNVLQSTGNAGVGTTTPESILTVQTTGGDTDGSKYVRIKNTNSFTGLLFDPNQSGDAKWLLLGGYPNAGDFTIREHNVANYFTIKKATGYVGIGTSNPTRPLEVLAADGEAVRLYRNANNVGWGVNLKFSFNDSSSAQVDYAGLHGIIEGNTAGSHGGSLVFTTATSGSLTEKMRLTSTGYFGIGSNAPWNKLAILGTPGNREGISVAGQGNQWIYTDLQLTPIDANIAAGKPVNFLWSVRKDAYYGGDASGPSLVMEVPRQGSGVFVPFIINPSGNVILQGATNATNGNVGIGNFSPGYKLDVAGQIRSSSGGFVFPDGTVQTTAAAGSGSSQWLNNATGIHYSSGNIGIGTDSPGAKLHLSAGDYSFALFGPNTTWGGSLAVGSGNSFLTPISARAQVLSSNGNLHLDGGVGENVYIAWLNASNTIINGQGGNVGIGTQTPGTGGYGQARLDIVGRMRVRADSTNTSGVWFNDSPTASGSTDTAFVGRSGSGTTGFWTANGWALNVHDNGNVGVGTTSPAARLDLGANAVTNQFFVYNNGPSATYGMGATVTNGLEVYTSTALNKMAFGTYNQTTFVPQMVLNAGKVGVGTASPEESLHVVGNIKVTGNINAKYQDVAEWVPSAEQLASGTVVVLDATTSNQVTSSTIAYDTRVAGVISAQPGITLGEKSDEKVLVATTGRVRVKVDASRAPINIGDLLVTSDIPGVAMKSEAVNLGGVQIHRPGTIIGKALEPLAKGQGEILVLLSLQ